MSRKLNRRKNAKAEQEVAEDGKFIVKEETIPVIDATPQHNSSVEKNKKNDAKEKEKSEEKNLLKKHFENADEVVYNKPQSSNSDNPHFVEDLIAKEVDNANKVIFVKDAPRDDKYLIEAVEHRQDVKHLESEVFVYKMNNKIFRMRCFMIGLNLIDFILILTAMQPSVRAENIREKYSKARFFPFTYLTYNIGIMIMICGILSIFMSYPMFKCLDKYYKNFSVFTTYMAVSMVCTYWPLVSINGMNEQVPMSAWRGVAENFFSIFEHMLHPLMLLFNFVCLKITWNHLNERDKTNKYGCDYVTNRALMIFVSTGFAGYYWMIITICLYRDNFVPYEVMKWMKPLPMLLILFLCVMSSPIVLNEFSYIFTRERKYQMENITGKEDQEHRALVHAI